MNLNQLYYFKELADKRQYTKAADNLYISQPTLTVSIKQLEKELNCKLFRHSGRYVTLTKYGRIFYETVVSCLNTLENGKKKIHQTIRRDQGNISIACIPTLVGTLLPVLIKEYNRQADNAPHFIIHDNPSYQVCQRIKQDRYDIGICSYVDDFKEFTYIPFYTQEIVAIVSKDSDLAKISEITPEELRGENIITYTQDITIGQDVTNALLASASDLKITNRLHDELAIAGQVIANNLVGVVANTVYLGGFNIHKIKLDLPADTRQLYLVYDPSRNLSPEMTDFIDFIKSKIDDLKERKYHIE
ncbi:LysR family transcriptional regulator [Lactobacillus crispatus]|uniref:LysR family transcriptional regulator n=1 Tax=Lactobacillus crispatus TaxID=47770 RepID=UPI00118EE910|nr:LysR family transcriptional regulator [Lactobacillus crispatus]KAA8814403.1 LysR family transcriptional regulator [Lactobacillus crispatus]TVS27860.1 LysR family transcriptional regulator [Lactobacillus crispatus]